MFKLHENTNNMKRLFKKPEDVHLKTNVRTSFNNVRGNSYRVQVISPYMFNDVINEPIVNLVSCSRCEVLENPDFMRYDLCEHCYHDLYTII